MLYSHLPNQAHCFTRCIQRSVYHAVANGRRRLFALSTSQPGEMDERGEVRDERLQLAAPDEGEQRGAMPSVASERMRRWRDPAPHLQALRTIQRTRETKP